MVGRALTGTLVLVTYAVPSAGIHNPLALPLGLTPFAVDLLLWLAYRLPLKTQALNWINLSATAYDLLAAAAVVLVNLIPLQAVPLFVVLPLDELAIRYHDRGAAVGLAYALGLVSYAIIRHGGPWTSEAIVTFSWFGALIVMLAIVRGTVTSFYRSRMQMLLERSERIVAMAGQLSTLLELSRELLEQRDVNDVLSSIAVGVSRIFGFKYVTISFQRHPGGDFERRILWGFPPDIVAERTGEIVNRARFLEALAHSQEIVDHCYYTPAEHYVSFESEIYVGDLPRHAPRAKPGAWHERDVVVLVMTDQRGDIIGYMSVDGPYDGMVPSRETMASMQIFVNMAGLAIINAEHTTREGERARAEEDARRLQMEFLSDVSHEIRAPLATIQGASSLLWERGEGLEPARRRELLDALRDASKGLARMVEDLLLLSRLEAGHFRLFPEPVDLLAVVRDAVRAALAEHPGSPISLSLPPDPPPPVWADAQRLQQIIVNLLSNALKYSPPHSPVYVEVTTSPRGARVAVTDHGPGIPEHERAKLFTRFGRLSNAKADSTGLGLYISKGLAQAMEGDLDVDSEPGAGTTFFLSLRYADAGTGREASGTDRDDVVGGSS